MLDNAKKRKIKKNTKILAYALTGNSYDKRIDVFFVLFEIH